MKTQKKVKVELMSDTIAAISTPAAAGGIGVIRISGDEAIETAQRVVRINAVFVIIRLSINVNTEGARLKAIWGR